MSRLGRLDADSLTLTQGCLRCRNKRLLWCPLTGFYPCDACAPKDDCCMFCGGDVEPFEQSAHQDCRVDTQDGFFPGNISEAEYMPDYWGDLWLRKIIRSGNCSS